MSFKGEAARDLTKAISMGAIFFVQFSVGLIPLKSKKFNTNVVIMGCFNSFAAGVFICFGIASLLNESQKDFDAYFDNGAAHTRIEKRFPYPYTIAVLAFVFVLFIEKILFDVPHSHGTGDDEEGHGHGGHGENSGHGGHGGHGGHDDKPKTHNHGDGKGEHSGHGDSDRGSRIGGGKSKVRSSL